jgi:hypothetical protein
MSFRRAFLSEILTDFKSLFYFNSFFLNTDLTVEIRIHTDLQYRLFPTEGGFQLRQSNKTRQLRYNEYLRKRYDAPY